MMSRTVRRRLIIPALGVWMRCGCNGGQPHYEESDEDGDKQPGEPGAVTAFASSRTNYKLNPILGNVAYRFCQFPCAELRADQRHDDGERAEGKAGADTHVSFSAAEALQLD